MLMCGSSIPFNLDATTQIYNLASFMEINVPKLQFLIPPIPHSASYEFDVAYASYLMNDNNAFVELYSLMLVLESGIDVFLLVSEFDWTENIVESLFKFIQQRYGYQGVKITDKDDYIYFKDTIFDFNPDYGIYNLDCDRDRYSLLVERTRISNGGEVCTMV